MNRFFKFFCIALVSLLSICGCLDSGNKNAQTLILDEVWRAADYELDDHARAKTNAYLSLMNDLDYMTLYRAVYLKLYSAKNASFKERFTAAVAILIASHNLAKGEAFKNSGKRLFIHFCRKALLEAEFAVNFSKLDRKYLIFTEDKEVKSLWRDYIREVWAAKVRPQIKKTRKANDKHTKFFQAFPDLKNEMKKDLEPPFVKEDS